MKYFLKRIDSVFQKQHLGWNVQETQMMKNKKFKKEQAKAGLQM